MTHHRQTARLLPDGKRLHLNDGPIDLILSADGAPDAIRTAYRAALTRFETILDELCQELPLLRRPPTTPPQGQTGRAMWQAVLPHASDNFITPMAAVAGAVADTILAAMTQAAPLTRAFVNNGGDIALHLAPGHHYTAALIDRPDRPTLTATTTIRADHPIRGIATSGWRGRSFSLGIADAVTILAADAATADACATIVANAVDLPGHPAILRRPAYTLQPDSDLGDRPVTTAVAPLTPAEIAQALASGAIIANRLHAAGTIAAAILRLANETLIVGDTPQ